MGNDMTHKHMSNLDIAAATLRRDGHISAMTTIYNGTCECGEVKRNTRLAATIWALRNEWGWDIETTAKPAMLADYVLKSEGRTPETHFTKRKAKAAKPTQVLLRPTVNRKPAVTPEDVPQSDMHWCPLCMLQVGPGEAVLGGYVVAYCPECRKTVQAQPWKPVEPVELVDPRAGIRRRSQAKKTY